MLIELFALGTVCVGLVRAVRHITSTNKTQPSACPNVVAHKVHHNLVYLEDKTNTKRFLVTCETADLMPAINPKYYNLSGSKCTVYVSHEYKWSGKLKNNQFDGPWKLHNFVTKQCIICLQMRGSFALFDGFHLHSNAVGQPCLLLQSGGERIEGTLNADWEFVPTSTKQCTPSSSPPIEWETQSV